MTISEVFVTISPKRWDIWPKLLLASNMIPTNLLRDCIDAILPYLTAMVNASLCQGCLPVSQKKAVVTPLLKKPSLDVHDLKNYRPVSNLSFFQVGRASGS